MREAVSESEIYAERVALGAIIKYTPLWEDVEECVSASDFGSQMNRRIFRALALAANNLDPFDVALIVQAMNCADFGEIKNTTIYIASMIDDCPTAKYWTRYLKTVVENSHNREYRRLAAEITGLNEHSEQRIVLQDKLSALGVLLQTGVERGLDYIDLTVTPEVIPWLVRNIIPEQGRTLLVAPSGVGKSWILEDIAICVATGKPWLGLEADFPVRDNRGPVIIVDEESGAGRIHSRLARLALGHGTTIAALKNRIFVSCLNGVNTGNPETWGRLHQDVKRLKPSLVILDAAIRILDGDENDSATLALFWRAVTQLQAHGTAVAIAHHTGWGNVSRARGSSDFPGGTDVELTLTRQDNPDVVQMEWTKVKDRVDDVVPEPMFIRRRIDKESARLVVASETESEEKPRLAAFLAALEDGPKTNRELQVLLQVSSNTVARDSIILKESGRIISGQDGYGLVPPQET